MGTPDSGFDYAGRLSLDQAKLVGRTRINNLGSYELTLNYNKISSAIKEDCLEYLEANALELTDPTFSNKTYEGVWKCVSISYDEARSIIQQVFKIDSQVGNLGDVDEESDYSAQTGDVSHVSSGGTVEKAYYWKVVNPTDILLPAVREGEVWTKTANDNGDGTYDVVVSKSEATNQEGGSGRAIGGEADGGTTSIYVSGLKNDDGANQEYALYLEFVCWAYDTPPTGLDKAVFYDTGTLESGLPVYEDVASLWNLWSDGTSYYITSTSDTVGTVPSSYYISDNFYDGYAGMGSYLTKDAIIRSTLDLTTVGSIQVGAPEYAKWVGVDDDDYTIYYDGSKWSIYNLAVAIASRGPITGGSIYPPGLNSDLWIGAGTDDDENLVVQIGKNPPAYTEDSITYSNSVEFKFVSDGGVIGVDGVADPVTGEEKTISNVPLDNGLFRVTVTTRTVAKQRVPALFDSMIFAGNGNEDENAFIGSSNATFEDLQKDLNYLKLQKTDLLNSVSISINKYGLYDYTIRSKEKLPF